MEYIKTLLEVKKEIEDFNINAEKQKEQLDGYLLENIKSLSNEEFVKDFLNFLVKVKLFNSEMFAYITDFLKVNALNELANNLDKETVSTLERFENKNLETLNNIKNILNYIEIINNSINLNIKNYIKENIKHLNEKDIDHLVEAIRILKNKNNIKLITMLLPYKAEDFNKVIEFLSNTNIIKQNPKFWQSNENIQQNEEYNGIQINMQIKPKG